MTGALRRREDRGTQTRIWGKTGSEYGGRNWSHAALSREFTPGIVGNHQKLEKGGTSLVVQWLRISLPREEHRFDLWSGK